MGYKAEKKARNILFRALPLSLPIHKLLLIFTISDRVVAGARDAG